MFFLSERDGAKLLVYEYAPNGSLLEYMIGKFKHKPWSQRICYQMNTNIGFYRQQKKPNLEAKSKHSNRSS